MIVRIIFFTKFLTFVIFSDQYFWLNFILYINYSYCVQYIQRF